MKIIIIALIIPLLNFSQSLNGSVLDSISKEKLVLANITFLRSNNGTNTDLNGNYYLNIKEHLNDSIKISFIGYKAKYLSLKKFIENKEYNMNFNLVREEILLEEILIISKTKKFNKKYVLSENRKGDVSMFSVIGYETACLIENPKNEIGQIKSLKLYIRKNKKAEFIAKFRIKIYSYNKADNIPGESLLNEDLIISPKNKNYQYIIDLEQKRIPFLEDGICIGIELVDENNVSKKGDKIGPGIRFTYGENKQLTWYNYRNRTWGENRIVNINSKDISNLMVGLTVLMKD